MLSRNITIAINKILDNWVPPILRDARWFMYPVMKMAYGSCAKDVMDFKEKFPFMSEEELSTYYEYKAVPRTQRDTDLNTACLNYILENLEGDVLDAACGRGALLQAIRKKHKAARLHGVDIVPPNMDTDIAFTQGSICNLPFQDDSFDTVLCTHALEHIRDHELALNELVRVAKRRIIIVCPKQREYKYTPDLHIHFLPYLYRFKTFIGIQNAVYFELNNDFVCVVNF